MFFYEGYLCPVCKKKFEETDDIVACPACGAPHHRECWLQHGGCRYAEDHGTSRQWKRPEDTAHSSGSAQSSDRPVPPYAHSSGQVRTCSRCGKVNPEYAEFCSRCGQTMSPPDWSGKSSSGQPSNDQSNNNNAPYGGSPFSGGFGSYGEYTPFHMPVMDPFGGVPKEEHIDDVPVEDIVTFVGPNSSYYLPRFVKMKRHDSVLSWNWPAFLITPYWLLYRKNYVSGGILLFLSLVETFLNSYIMGVYIQPALDTSSDTAMFQSMYSLVEGGTHTLYFMILFLLFVVNFLVRLLFGLIGNSLYMRTTLTRVREVRRQQGMSDQAPMEASLRHTLVAKGGVSLLLIAAASGIVWLGQLIIQALFLYT